MTDPTNVVRFLAPVKDTSVDDAIEQFRELTDSVDVKEVMFLIVDKDEQVHTAWSVVDPMHRIAYLELMKMKLAGVLFKA